MKRLIHSAALALALTAVSPSPVAAQTGGGSMNTSGTATNQPALTDRGFDWGWFGLLGLAGLIPLFLRRNAQSTRTNFTGGVGGSGRGTA